MCVCPCACACLYECVYVCVRGCVEETTCLSSCDLDASSDSVWPHKAKCVTGLFFIGGTYDAQCTSGNACRL